MPLSKSKTKPKPSVAEPQARVRVRFAAIGTAWTLDIFEHLDDKRAQEVEAAVRGRIAQFDRCYSRFRDDSLVARMAREAGAYELPPDARPLLDLYQEIYALTDGAVTPLVGQLLSDAGYDAQYSLRPGQLRRSPRWEDTLEYAWPRLVLRQPALMDVGAAGKGYLVDVVAAVLREHNVRAFCVDAGGDMTYQNPAGGVLRVGLEHPTAADQAIGVAELAPGHSLCGSAGNRRAWGTFHHIIDPRTLDSPKHLHAMWVVAPTTLLADMLATCLFFVSPERLKRYTFEYALVRDDFSLEHSAHFPATFFTS
jgi:FAD:protein FMN transferase